MRVDVSGQRFMFPYRCACCLGRAETELEVSASKSSGKRAVHTQMNAWDVPYCSRCVRHVRAAGLADAIGWLVFLISAIAAFVTGYNSSGDNGAIVFGAGVAIVIVLYPILSMRAKLMCSRVCSCVTAAVLVRGWHGSVHGFEFVAEEYALDFMLDNERKLVNVSSKARALLEAGGRRPSTRTPRGPRRFRS